MYRIPDSSPLNSPLVATSEVESTSSGSITVNSGLCIAPSGDSTAGSALLVQVSCTTAAARTWAISGA